LDLLLLLFPFGSEVPNNFFSTSVGVSPGSSLKPDNHGGKEKVRKGTLQEVKESMGINRDGRINRNGHKEETEKRKR
jgi:hypothetical protein